MEKKELSTQQDESQEQLGRSQEKNKQMAAKISQLQRTNEKVSLELRKLKLKGQSGENGSPLHHNKSTVEDLILTACKSTLFHYVVGSCAIVAFYTMIQPRKQPIPVAIKPASASASATAIAN